MAEVMLMAPSRNNNAALKWLGKNPAIYPPQKRESAIRRYAPFAPVGGIALPRNLLAAVKRTMRKLGR